MAPQGRPGDPNNFPPSSASVTGSRQRDAAATARNAALQGATLAFQSQRTGVDKPPKPTPRAPKPILGNDGAGARLGAPPPQKGDGNGPAASPRPKSPVSEPKGNDNRGVDGLRRQATGSSLHEVESGAATQPSTTRQHNLRSASPRRPSALLMPSGKPNVQPKSPSLIAATLAASRSASPTLGPGVPRPAPSPLPDAEHNSLVGNKPGSRQSPGMNNSNSQPFTAPAFPDSSPIPPAVSLISLFEKKDDDTDPVKRRDPSLESTLTTKGKPRPLTPPRPLSPQTDDSVVESRTRPAVSKPALRPKPARGNCPATPPQTIHRTVPEVVSPEPRRIGRTPTLLPPGPPSPRVTPEPTFELPARSPDPRQPRPMTPIPAQESRPSGTVRRNAQHPSTPAPPSPTGSVSSNDTFVSASSVPSPQPPSPSRDPEPAGGLSRSSSRQSMRAFRPKSSSAMRLPPTYTNRPGGRFSPHPAATTVGTTNPLPLESLTSAIMAGNLASARHPPSAPSRDSSAPPLPPPPRRPGHHQPTPLHPQHTNGSTDHGRRKGSNSPQRRTAMLQTLRQPTSHSDDEEARRRMQRHRKGGKKHRHHEGARKRWRDEVLVRERRRYEAVWASNKGAFLQPVAPTEGGGSGGSGGSGRESEPDVVVNVVVRDIWSRSRLPRDELAEVWDLVDRSGIGALSKQEFVVGMWLIDQRLRGGKIPTRVTDSVWDSARGLRVAEPKRK